PRRLECELVRLVQALGDGQRLGGVKARLALGLLALLGLAALGRDLGLPGHLLDDRRALFLGPLTGGLAYGADSLLLSSPRVRERYTERLCYGLGRCLGLNAHACAIEGFGWGEDPWLLAQQHIPVRGPGDPASVAPDLAGVLADGHAALIRFVECPVPTQPH